MRPLALTMGDPAGIGPDITLMAWTQRRALGLAQFVVYADARVLAERAAVLELEVPILSLTTPDEAVRAFDHALPVADCGTCGAIEAGKPSTANAAATIAAIDLATADVMAGKARALVTNPIAKSVLYAAGFRHPGHTEYLAYLAGRAEIGRRIVPVMMLACDTLRVVSATIHIPLAAVPAALTRELLIETIEITAEGLRRDFAIAQPRIAVCGLNPHAGENGTIGMQERDLIGPVVAELAARGLCVTGPHSADTLFHAAARARYDAAVCMYHDQALIPIKTLAFDEGVNVTLGLPFVRTSPDHGTAFDIAGTGKASASSLIAALRMAEAIARAHGR